MLAPIAVTPSAVVEVPMAGKFALAASGNALKASPDSVGPRTSAVCPSVMNFCMMLTTWAGSVAASCTSNVTVAPPASSLPDLKSSLAMSYAFFCDVPYTPAAPVTSAMTPILTVFPAIGPPAASPGAPIASAAMQANAKNL